MTGNRLIEALFWCSAAAVVYPYIIYPALLAVLAAFRRKRHPENEVWPRVSILIAAHNEKTAIARKLDETLQLDYPADRLEVLVLSDASDDGTDEIVSAYSDARVRLLRAPERFGKTKVQNMGARAATGEILVFSDATTSYDRHALRYLISNYRDPKVGAVAGRYDYRRGTGESPTGTGTILYWNYENLIKRFQARIYSLTGCSGCIYSVRKSAYTELPHDIISDLVQPLWVLKQGYRVEFDERAHGFEETTSSSGEEFAMRVRVVARAIHGLMTVRELLNPFRRPWIAFQLWSHKMLRWMAPFGLLVLFTTSVAMADDGRFYLWMAVAQAGFYLAALLGSIPAIRRRIPLFAVATFFCVINLAAVYGVAEFFCGKKYIVWDPVRSQAHDT